MSSSDRRILAIVGPTASGKTDLALELAARLGGEIVSADMGQQYKRLNAGTAKPPGRWRGGVYRVRSVPYHLVDVLDPSEPTDAGRFADTAGPVLESILKRGKTPIVAGGTGLYVRALLDGLDPLPRRDEGVRARLKARAGREGWGALHEELARLDPEAARSIPPGNRQRIARALEVLELTGKPISSLWTGRKAGRCAANASPEGGEHGAAPQWTPRNVVYVGIGWEMPALRERIRARAELMFPAMLREVAALVPRRYTGAEPGFRCLGYPEALACARGGLSRKTALTRMVSNTIAYAKRQRTWFRGQTPARWLRGEADHRTVAAEALSLWNG